MPRKGCCGLIWEGGLIASPLHHSQNHHSKRVLFHDALTALVERCAEAETTRRRVLSAVEVRGPNVIQFVSAPPIDLGHLVGHRSAICPRPPLSADGDDHPQRQRGSTSGVDESEDQPRTSSTGGGNPQPRRDSGGVALESLSLRGHLANSVYQQLHSAVLLPGSALRELRVRSNAALRPRP